MTDGLGDLIKLLHDFCCVVGFAALLADLRWNIADDDDAIPQVNGESGFPVVRRSFAECTFFHDGVSSFLRIVKVESQASGSG